LSNFIGRGEKSAEKILQFCFPKSLIVTQVPIKLVWDKLAPADYPGLSQEQMDSSIDIMVFGNVAWKKPMIAFRVQNGINQKGKIRGHAGDTKHPRDEAQKHFLEDCGVIVADAKEWECKQLFKERVNYLSVLEVCTALWNAE